MTIEIPDEIFIRALNNTIEQNDEIVCHCEIKENAELIAEILTADSEGRYYLDSNS